MLLSAAPGGHSWNCASACLRPLQVGFCHESAPGVGEGAGLGGLRGLAAAEEGGSQLPVQQVEEVLVRAEQQLPLLVHRQDGEHTTTAISANSIRIYSSVIQLDLIIIMSLHFGLVAIGG